MRESLSAFATMPGLLRSFHSSCAGRSQAEKHLCCARSSALWTYIRNLLCKGKVGQRAGRGLPRGTLGQGPCCWMSAALANSRFLKREGPSDYCSLERKGRASPAQPACFPFFKTPSGGVE